MDILTEQLNKDFSVNGTSTLDQLKQSAFDRFTAQGYPSTREEAWRYTSVVSLTKTAYHSTAGMTPKIAYEGDLPEGVRLETLSTVLKTDPHIIEPYLTRFAKDHEQPFEALNTAFFQEGFFLYVPQGVVLKSPITLTYPMPDSVKGTLFHPRNLIVAEAGSQISVVEIHEGPDGEKYWTNAVTDVVAGENAHVHYYQVQNAGDAATHFSTLHVQQDRDSHFGSYVFSFGGQLARHTVQTVLGAEGSHCDLIGLTIGSQEQHIDHQTTIDHAKSHTTSDEFYKNILSGKSAGVFNGQIIVRPDAQKTNAEQSNRNLLLSEQARINTKPNLEIYANDVKCTHGATIGRLDEKQLFYLRSRGLDLATAKELLTHAFASDVIQRVPDESVRRRLEELVSKKLKGLSVS